MGRLCVGRGREGRGWGGRICTLGSIGTTAHGSKSAGTETHPMLTLIFHAFDAQLIWKLTEQCKHGGRGRKGGRNKDSQNTNALKRADEIGK